MWVTGRWAPVPEYEEYFMVSDKGDVWSLRSNKILKQTISKSGYKVISSKIGGRKGKAICKKVHRWVAEAFIENPESKRCVNHKDCNKTNNDYNNLEWCTHKENSEHAVENDLLNTLKGEGCAQSRLTEEVIESIRKRYKPYCKVNGLRAIAKEIGIPHNTLSFALSGKTWKHLL